MQLQLLESLVDCVEASGERRLGGCRSPHQLSFCGDDEVRGPEAHVRARDIADAMGSHPKPDESDETRKGPYLTRQLSVFQTAKE
jgi:hypothetical protein